MPEGGKRKTEGGMLKVESGEKKVEEVGHLISLIHTLPM